MARKWSNLNIPGALHFVTGNVLNRIPVFTDERYCQEFWCVCADVKKKWPATVIAYVLMPDHFHLIANPRDGDIQGFIGALKEKLTIQISQLTGDCFVLPKPRPDGSTHQMGDLLISRRSELTQEERGQAHLRYLEDVQVLH